MCAMLKYVLIAMALAGPASAQDRPPHKPEAPRADTAGKRVAGPAPDAGQAEPVPAVVPQESDFDHAACLLGLFLAGAKWESPAPIRNAENPDCAISHPVRITEIAPGVTIPGGAVMRCDVALALSRWTRDVVQPAARHLPGTPRLIGYTPGSTYQCRRRVGGTRDKISQHALGNAFDIMAFRFSDHDDLLVRPRQDNGNLAEAFQHAVRGGACLYFTTVLGPGSNAAHDDHLHLDLAPRKGGWRLCQ